MLQSEHWFELASDVQTGAAPSKLNYKILKNKNLLLARVLNQSNTFAEQLTKNSKVNKIKKYNNTLEVASSASTIKLF